MKIITKVLLTLLVCCFVAAANGASFEVFLKIEGIEGDSTADRHENEINVVSFNIGVLNSGPLPAAAEALRARRSLRT